MIIKVVGKKIVKNLISLCIYEFNKKKLALVNKNNYFNYVNLNIYLFINRVYNPNRKNILPPNDKYFCIYFR